MSKVVFVSGVHGVGKSTVIQEVARRLEKAGQSVYVFPEMSYITDIPIQTMEFQIWFKKQITARDFMVNELQKSNFFDYILVDRAWYDIDIYTNRLKGYTDSYIGFSGQTYKRKYVLLTEEITPLLMRVQERNRQMDWNEDDVRYLQDIVRMFNDFHDAHRDKVRKFKNINLNETVQRIMEWIY